MSLPGREICNYLIMLEAIGLSAKLWMKSVIIEVKVKGPSSEQASTAETYRIICELQVIELCILDVIPAQCFFN